MFDPDLRPRLLVVESDDGVRRVLERMLHNRYDLTAVSAASAALGTIQKERFDALLLDLGQADALDLLKAASAVKLGTIVTSDTTGADWERSAWELGALAFLSKPYDAHALDAALERTLGTKARRGT